LGAQATDLRPQFFVLYQRIQNAPWRVMLSESEASEATSPRKGKCGCFALAQHDTPEASLEAAG